MIKVLVVDDSAVVRRVLSDELAKAGDIEVVATATDPFVARDKILALHPDVLTLDLQMPRMDGLTFLATLMKHYPMPVIVVSAHTAEGSEAAIRALELGAIGVVGKPTSVSSLGETSRRLVESVREAASARSSRLVPWRAARASPLPVPAAEARTEVSRDRVVAIGASTGGTEAIGSILSALPASTPGTLIVQHMPEHFTGAFARRLNEVSAMEVREARQGDPVLPGVALVAPGNFHLVVRRSGNRYFADVKDGPPVHHQRPSVEVLFQSVARSAGPWAVGVILTGMGTDGARGLLAMRDAGSRTLAQDEESSVVFGMPKEAIRIGAAEAVLPLDRMARAILDAISAAGSKEAGARGSGAR